MDYGYEAHPANIAFRFADRVSSAGIDKERIALENSTIIYEACWELCRRRVLRPGVLHFNKQATADGGYCLTSFGRQWIKDADETDLIVLNSGSLSTVLASYKNRYGDGFYQRSQEAIRCRQSEAWLACCAMVGAASESVLLALAITAKKDEVYVLSEYLSKSGRSKIVNMLVGKKPKYQSETLSTFMGLLSYWRDDAAHGQFSEIGVANADEALRQLLHLCQWADKNWASLTAA